VYVRDQDSAELRFHALCEPTQEDVTELARRVASRIEKVLKKFGRWFEDGHSTESADPLAQAQPVFSSCYQAAAQGRELLGERSSTAHPC
jgi:hypothetical protein